MIRILNFILIGALSLACTCEDCEPEDNAFLLDAGSPSASAPDAGSTQPTGTCNAQVVIEFYTDDDCVTKVTGAQSTRTYDTTQSCFSWTGNSAAGENSVTNFQCFRDRLCYTQHPASLACDVSRPTNEEAKTNDCVLDTQNPNGNVIYARIISGTENCPEPPDGFECPVSEPGEGTTGINACKTEP